MRTHDEARLAIKQVVEMPGQDADRIVRSLKQGDWVFSNKLRGEFPILFEPGERRYDRAQRLVAAVRAAFEEDETQASMAPAEPSRID